MRIAIRLLFRLITYGPAIAAGLGIISMYWLIGAAVAAYLLSILDESDKTPSGDFRNMETSEFLAADTNIKKRLCIGLGCAGILFLLSLGVSHFLIGNTPI